MGQISSGSLTIVDVTDGAPGLNNTTVFLYQRAVNAPDKPTGNLTYTFATATVTGSLDGWVQNINSLTGSNPIWMIAAVASSNGSTDVIEPSEWAGPIKMAQNGQDGQPGTNGTNGLNQATVFIYKRGDSATTPSSVTYTFSTGNFTTPSGWNKTIPTTPKGKPCWVTSAIAIGAEATAELNWATPSVLVEDGTDGISPTVTATENGVKIVDADGNETTITNGADGISYYTFVRYSQNANGSGYVVTPTSETIYIGVYTGTESSPPVYSDAGWKWSRYVGADGQPGTPGTPGTPGVSVTATRELYYLKTNSTDPAQITNANQIHNTDDVNQWTSVVPTYIGSGKYYTCIETNLSNGNSVWSAPIENKGLTDANVNAANAIEIARGVKQHFFWVATDKSENVPAGAYVAEQSEESFYSSPTKGNILTRSDGIWIRNGADKLATLQGSGLTFLVPTGTYKGQKSVSLNGSGLTFYNIGSSNSAAATLASDGLQIENGSITLGGHGTSGINAGDIALSNKNFTRSINGIPHDNLRFAIGSKFGVASDGTLYSSGLDSVISRVDDIEDWEIGGRNLLRRTKTYEGWEKTSSVTLTQDEEGITVANWPQVDTASWREIRSSGGEELLIPYSLVRDREVTLSCWFKMDAIPTSDINGILHTIFSLNNAGTYNGNRKKYTNNVFSGKIKQTTDWQRVVWTGTISNALFVNGTGTIADTDLLYIQVYNHNLPATHVKKIKLEYGNRVTDWTPAPEDTDAKITELNTSITQNADAIKLEAVRRESAVNMLLDSDAKKDESSDYPSTSSTNIAKVNGPEYRYWSDSGSPMITCTFVSISDPPESGIKYAARFVCDGTQTAVKSRGYAFYSGNGNKIPLTLGQTYTASWWARCTSGSGQTRLDVTGKSATETYIYTPNENLTSTWKRYTYTFTFNALYTTSDYQRIWFRSIFPASTAGTVEICGCKLIAGDSIEQYKTTIEQTADNVLIKATKNYSKDSSLTDAQNGGKAAIQSLINVAPEGVQISADKVNITGTTIFNAVNSDASAKAAMLNSELEIGGRNILGYTGDFANWRLNSAYTTVSDGELSFNISGLTSNGFTRVHGWILPNVSELTGKTIVVSAEVYSDDWSTVESDRGDWHRSICLQMQYTNVAKWDKTSSYVGLRYRHGNFGDASLWDVMPTTMTNGKWHRIVSKPILLPDDLNTDVASGTGSEITIQPMLVRNGRVKFRHLKVEIGNKSTDWSPAPEDAEEQINAIEIGGKNILRGTNNITIANGFYPKGEWYKSGTGTVTTSVAISDSPLPAFTTAVQLTTTAANTEVGIAQGGVPFRTGEITHSVWVKGTAGDTIRLQPIWAQGTNVPESGNKSFTIADGNWHKYTFTKSVAYNHPIGSSGSAANNTYANAGYVYFKSATVGHSCLVIGDMLEYGNKVTDWTPAPEDVQAEIDAKKSIFTVNATGTDASQSYAQILSWAEEGRLLTFAVDSTAGIKIGDTVRIKTTVSNMSNAPVYIVTTCRETPTSNTSIKTTSHGLDTTVIDGGNILTNSIGANQMAANAITADKIAIGAINEYENILLDSDAPTMTKVKALYDRYWSNAESDKIVCSNFSLTDAPEQGLKYGRRFVYDGSVATNNYYRAYAFYSTADNAIPLVPNQTYTATWWARCTSGSGRTQFYHTKGNGATGGVGSTTYTLTSYWKKYTYSFTYGSALNTDYNRIWFRALFPASTAGTVEICGCKLTVGADAESYITRIDDNGIRIHPSSTENNSVVIDASGMQIYKNNVSVAEYGDTARVGRASANRFLMNASSLQAYDSSNNLYFEVSASGLTYGTNTAATTTQVSNAQSTANTANNRAVAYRGVCSTAAGTAAKVVTCDNFSLVQGAAITIYFTTANTASAAITLNVNSTGAKNVRYSPSGNTSTNSRLMWDAGATMTFIYDGTQYRLEDNIRIRSAHVGQSSNTTNVTSKPWFKFASVIAYGANTDYYVTFRVENYPSSDRTGLLKVRIRTDGSSYVAPNSCIIYWDSLSNNMATHLEDFVLAYKASTANSTVELWCKIAENWGSYNFTLVSESTRTTTDTMNWTLYNQTTDGGSAAVTSGYTTIASTTKMAYITHIDNKGIRIHPSNTENNSVVINSEGMEVFQGGTESDYSVAKYGDTVRIGKESSSHAVLDSEGMDIYQKGISVAHYGDYARVGIDGEANTTISPNQVTISASGNINALRITPDGNTQTVHHSITKQHPIEAGKTYVFTQPSAIPSGTTAQYKLSHKSNSLARFEIKKGTSKSTTSVTTPFPFQYSATTTQVTIKNTGSALFYLQDISYFTTEVSPLTEVGGVLALGQYPSIGTNDVLNVGYGSSKSRASCFSVTKSGLVSCRSLTIQENDIPIYLTTTDGWEIDALSADASNNLILGRGWWAQNTSGFNTYIEGYQTNIWGRNKIATNMAITQGSDKRLKKDIKDLEDVKDFVMDLKPVEFKYEFASDKDKHLGFIAQDVEKSMNTYGLSSDKYGLITEITGTDNIQYKGLNYTEFIPMCIKMIQEQQQEIDALKEALNEILGN